MKRSQFLIAVTLVVAASCGERKRNPVSEVKQTQTPGLPATPTQPQVSDVAPTQEAVQNQEPDIIDHLRDLSVAYGETEVFGELARKVVGQDGDSNPADSLSKVKILGRLERLKKVRELQLQIVTDQQQIVQNAVAVNGEYEVRLATGFLAMVLPGSALSLGSRFVKPKPLERVKAPNYDDFMAGKLPTREMTIKEFDTVDPFIVNHPKFGTTRLSVVLNKITASGADAAALAAERKAWYELYHADRYYSVYRSLIPGADALWKQRAAQIGAEMSSFERRASTSRAMLMVGGLTLVAGALFESVEGIRWMMSTIEKTDAQLRLGAMKRDLEFVLDQLASAEADLIKAN